MKISDINKRFIAFTLNRAKTLRDRKPTRSKAKQRFFDIKETAEYLNMSTKTIYNKISLRTFPIKEKRLGGKVLFEVSDVVKYADSL